MSATEMVDDRWEQEVTGPGGERRVVVAVRRHDALHSSDDTPLEARGSEAGLAVSALAFAVRAWRKRRNPGWTVAVLSAPGVLGQKVLFREDLPIEADAVARARAVADQVRRGDLAS